MLNNKIVIIPTLDPPDSICDYQTQTAKVMAKSNLVIFILLDKPKSFKELLSQFIKTGQRFHLQRYKNTGIIFLPVIQTLPFSRFTSIRKFNFRLYILFIKIYLRLLSIVTKRQALVWIFYPYVYDFATSLINYPLIYDIVDYHTSYNQRQEKCLRQADRWLVQKANVVTVNSAVLHKKYQPLRQDVIQVPQGFALDEFAKPIKPSKKWRFKKPTIGFVGNISQRLDYILLSRLITKASLNWQFVFVGPKKHEKIISEDKNFAVIDKLISHRNVSWIDKQPKEEVPAIISQFDVCIIPYDNTYNFNRLSHPMKLFEYFYVGKPVVATPIEELKHFPKFVKIGKNAAEWEKHIKNLLVKSWPESYKLEQRKLALANSWKKKITAISKIIESQYGQ